MTNRQTSVAVSPAAMAWATRLTEDTFRDVYALAVEADKIAEEARTNERKRIFEMGFLELCREFWKGRKLYNPDHHDLRDGA